MPVAIPTKDSSARAWSEFNAALVEEGQRSDRFDAVEVLDAAGDLDGYQLVNRRDRSVRGTVQCCRTCAWGELKHMTCVGHVVRESLSDRYRFDAPTAQSA